MANTEDEKDSQKPDKQPQSGTGPSADETAAGAPSDAEETGTETDPPRGEDPTVLEDDRDVFEPKSPSEEHSNAASSGAAAGAGRGGLTGPVIGGVLAAVIGYGAAQFVKPEGWPFPGTGGDEEAQAALQATADRVSETTDRLAELEAQVSELAAGGDGAPDLSEPVRALETELSALTDRVDGLDERIAGLDGRLAELDERIAGLDTRMEEVAKTQIAAAGEQAAEAVAAYEREIAAMRDELAAQRDENAKLAESVAAVADEAEAELDAAMERTAQIETRAALMRIGAALASGAPFDSALDQIEGVEVPQALAAVAAEGVPTLADLRSGFPAAARAALDVARQGEAQGDAGDRMGAFLRSQLGLRSLEPREGDDADAVLSRAEAALRAGDLRAALAEIETLPEPVRAEMSGWIDDATARADAVEAAETLEQRLNN